MRAGERGGKKVGEGTAVVRENEGERGLEIERIFVCRMLGDLR